MMVYFTWLVGYEPRYGQLSSYNLVDASIPRNQVTIIVNLKTHHPSVTHTLMLIYSAGAARRD